MPAAFNPITIAAKPAPLFDRDRVRDRWADADITGPVDVRTVSALMKALAKGKRQRR
jgi:hypothetical protein